MSPKLPADAQTFHLPKLQLTASPVSASSKGTEHCDHSRNMHNNLSLILLLEVLLQLRQHSKALA